MGDFKADWVRDESKKSMLLLLRVIQYCASVFFKKDGESLFGERYVAGGYRMTWICFKTLQPQKEGGKEEGRREAWGVGRKEAGREGGGGKEGNSG